MKHTRLDVYQTMKQQGLVPLFNHDDAEICRNVIRACHKGGSNVFEFTNRGKNAIDVFKTILRESELEMPDVIIGVGSIVDASTAELFIQAGAKFVVSPVLNPEIIRLCNRRKIAVIPGCGSLSEISNAEELGAEIVKIFPALQVGGPAFVKAVLGPMPWVSIMPTGGVSLEEVNIRAWFDAGVACVGMGSNLIIKHEDGNYDYAEIAHNVNLALQWIKDFRESNS